MVSLSNLTVYKVHHKLRVTTKTMSKQPRYINAFE
ncbi:hypothetical protein LINPERHAP1_LOCUS37394, partial [Linum perenne]